MQYKTVTKLMTAQCPQCKFALAFYFSFRGHAVNDNCHRCILQEQKVDIQTTTTPTKEAIFVFVIIRFIPN